MLMPSHSVAIKGTVERLLQIAKELGLRGYELEELVKQFKENEARLINQQGLKAQMEYVFETFGPTPEGQDKASEDIRNVLMDHAKAGMLVRCTQCRRDEFRSEATKHGEGWLCPRCLKRLQEEGKA
jgi:hypothetical protein